MNIPFVLVWDQAADYSDGGVLHKRFMDFCPEPL